jgi:hypothetical protein
VRIGGLLACALAVAGPAHAACIPSGVVVADPAYTVARCWTATDLGVPRPLGGLRFSDDGRTLYLVGEADQASSAIWALAVTRDAASGEVVDLGAATTSFPGSPPTSMSGLDAGLEVGPGGTLFDVYFGVDQNADDVTFLGERPGGIAGAETLFDLSAAIQLSATGLVFSPFRTDPATQFGRLQVSVALGKVYELALAPAGGGLFTPGAATAFVTVQPGGLGAIQYVAGDLFYTSLDDGTVHRLAIDPATGLPIDRGTGIPLAGTANPEDAVFAASFAPGPIGLELDDTTGRDLFVSTYDGSLENVVYQIGGFSPSTTTTTANPAPACGGDASFATAECRLAALLATVRAADDLGALQAALVRKAARASERTAAAGADGRRGPARRALGAAIRALGGFRARLASRAGRKVAAATRTALSNEAGTIVALLRGLRGTS